MKEVALGIDIGGTNTVFGCIDSKGNCLATGSLPTQKHAAIEDYLNELFFEVESAMNGSAEKMQIIGVGIGAPNASFYTGTMKMLRICDGRGVCL